VRAYDTLFRGVLLLDGSGGEPATRVLQWQPRDWLGAAGEGPEFLRHATQVKNIWIPYGE